MILLLGTHYIQQYSADGGGNKTGDSTDFNRELILTDLQHIGQCEHKFFVRGQEDVLQVVWKYIDSFASVGAQNTSSVIETINKLFSTIRHHYTCYPLAAGVKGRHPCQQIYYKSWTPDYITEWHIEIPRWFLINITIMHAYIPFSDDCQPSQLAVHDRFNITQSSLIDLFCGVVKMEYVYTRGNKGTVRMVFDSAHIPYAVTLVAKYESHLKSLAFRNRLPCLPHFISSNTPISVVYFVEQKLHYIWYLAHGLYYTAFWYYYGMKSGQHSAGLVCQYANISLFMCTESSTQISIYPGLLPLYWMQWHSSPFFQLSCNQTETERGTLVDFHMHTTVLLTMHPFDTVNLSIEFRKFDKEIVQSVSMQNDNKGSLVTSQGSVFLEIHTFQVTEFWVDALVYSGDKTTVQSALVNTHENPVTKYRKHVNRGSTWYTIDSITEKGILHNL